MDRWAVSSGLGFTLQATTEAENPMSVTSARVDALAEESRDTIYILATAHPDEVSLRTYPSLSIDVPGH